MNSDTAASTARERSGATASRRAAQKSDDSSSLEAVRLISERLSTGQTPTDAWYCDQGIHELERKFVFGASWQLVGIVADVEQPGEFFPVEIDAHRTYIVVRGDDGSLRAFANVCPHRGNQLVDAPDCKPLIQCGYHGWSFDLAGTLRSAPGMDRSTMRKEELGLREVRADVWGPFVFLNPDPDAGPLATHLGQMPRDVKKYGIDMDEVIRTGHIQRFETTLECNWKIAVENALECYHCAIAHPGFRETVDLSQWQIDATDYCITQGTQLRAVDPLGLQEGTSVAGSIGQRLADVAQGSDGTTLNRFHWVFPNYSVSIWPGPASSFGISRWVPLGPHRTRRYTLRWWPEAVSREVREDQWEFMSVVGQEDTKIVQRVHKGMRSGNWTGGPYVLAPATTDVVRDERGPHRFNSLVAAEILR